MRSLLHESTIQYSTLRIISFLVAVWLCCTVSNALAQTDFDDITITPELQPTGDTSHGYAEYRVGISNRSPDKAHQVTLILPKRSHSYSGERIRGNNPLGCCRSVCHSLRLLASATCVNVWGCLGSRYRR